MQLLAACQRVPTVRRLVLKSTSAVYGASPRDPAVFTEAMQARQVPGGGFAKDSLDIEGYVRSFSRRRPEVDVAVLRFTNFIGPRIDSRSPASSACPWCPPRWATTPACSCCTRTTPSPSWCRRPRRVRRGTVNVGAEGTVLLSQAIRRLGRIALPLPSQAMGPLGRLTRQARITDYSPEQLRFLNFGRVVDTRVLREEFGYTPRYTTAEALADYGRTVVPVVDPALVGGGRRGRRGRRRADRGRRGVPGRGHRPARAAAGVGRAAGGARCLRRG